MKVSIPVSLPVWMLWHLAAVIAIVSIPSQLRTGKPLWALDAEHLTFLIGIAITYLVSILLVTLLVRRRRAVSLTELVLVVLSVFGCYFLYLLITESFYSRTLLAAAVGLSFIFIALSCSLRAPAQKTVLAVVAGVTLLLQALGPKPAEYVTQALGLGPGPQASSRVIDSLLYSIKALSFSHYFDVCSAEGGSCQRPGIGGGISRFADGYLVVTGGGELHFSVLNEEDASLKTRMLPYRIPINTGEYTGSGAENQLNVFRVTDVLVRDNGPNFLLLATHLFWKSAEKCVVMRLSKAEAGYAQFLAGETELKWQTIYETEPCLPGWKGSISGETGGRMAFLDDDKLLVTVGHNDFDGYNRTPMLPQDPSAAYGKTILVDLRSGAWEVYTLGHRNPHGLYVAPDGVIWSTEHGPKGGDELNILVPGANYGWPLVTHGTQYGMHGWPVSTNQGRHDGFQMPVFAWVPSIAVSNLVGVEQDLFPLWRHDLLIGSYKKALYRARIREGRVIYLETIPIPGRIRDLLEDDDGKIILYLDGGTLMVLRPIEGEGASGKQAAVSEDMRGQLMFAKCSGCHVVADGTSHGIGPDLAGIVGRPIAGVKGYSYSNALKKLTGTWTASKLDEFLANPQRFAPGTSMAFEGITDAADRAMLVDYLQEANER